MSCITHEKTIHIRVGLLYIEPLFFAGLSTESFSHRLHCDISTSSLHLSREALLLLSLYFVLRDGYETWF